MNIKYSGVLVRCIGLSMYGWDDIGMMIWVGILKYQLHL